MVAAYTDIFMELRFRAVSLIDPLPQLETDLYDSISHIFIAILSIVTSFYSPQQYTYIDVHPHICIDEHLPIRYCLYKSCNTLPITCFRFTPPVTTLLKCLPGCPLMPHAPSDFPSLPHIS